VQVYIPIPDESEAALKTGQIEVWKADDAAGAGEAKIVSMDWLDMSGNYRTSYRDGQPASAGKFYQVRFVASDTTIIWQGYLNPGVAFVEGERVTGAAQWTAGVEESLLSVLEAREFVIGLDSTIVPDWRIQKLIDQQKGEIETHIRASLTPETVTDEVYTGTNNNVLSLLHWPLLEVDEIKIEFPILVEKRVMEPHWVRPFNMERGTIQLITDAAVNAFITQSTNIPYQPLWNTFPKFPQAVYASYKHGWSGTRIWPPLRKGAAPKVEEMPLPGDLRMAWAKKTAIEILQIWGDAKGVGVASESIDGIARSYTASATTHIYSARIKAYQEDVKRVLDLYTRTFMAFSF
jgi:hypothetical protein